MSWHPEHRCTPATILVCASGTVSCPLWTLALRTQPQGSHRVQMGARDDEAWEEGRKEQAAFSLLWSLAALTIPSSWAQIQKLSERQRVFKMIRTRFLLWAPKGTLRGSSRKLALEQWYSIWGGAIFWRAALKITTPRLTQTHTCTHRHTHAELAGESDSIYYGMTASLCG